MITTPPQFRHRAFNPLQIGPETICTQAIMPHRRLFSGVAVGMIKSAKYIRDEGQIIDPQIPSSGFATYTNFAGHHAYPDLYADARTVDATSMFDMASVTKSIPVTLMVLWAVTNKLISLKDRVRRFFPGMTLKGSVEPVILDLLRYNVDFGLSSLSGSGYRLSRRELRNAVFKCCIEGNTGFNYTNYPSILLVHILKMQTGESFKQLVKEVLFDPLKVSCSFETEEMGMDHEVGSSQYVCTGLNPETNRPYEGVQYDPFSRASGLIGASGLFASCNDLLILLQFILEKGRIKGKQIIDYDLMGQLGNNQSIVTSERKFGLGFGCWSEFQAGFDPMTEVMNDIDPKYADGATFKNGHTGTGVYIFPRRKTGIVVLTNQNHPVGYNDLSRGLHFRYAAVMQLLSGRLPGGLKEIWKATDS